MKRLAAFGALAATVVFTACDSLGQAMTAHTDVVARAGGYELTVDEAAALLMQNPRLPADPEVVDAMANLWVDYVLLASAADHDSTLKSVDVSLLVDPMLEQQLFGKLNEKVINPDTTLSDQALRAIYEKEQPGLEIRARHILLRLAPDATAAQRDSALALARELRAQAAAGADFAKLAEQHSQDPGSAEQGGDLGFFGRGQMVAPFDAAAFALDVGQVSDVVETPFGYHVIKVEERKMADFETIKDRFREQAKAQMVMEAQEGYMTKLTEPLDIEVQDGAYEVARDLARKPMMQLSNRAASRALVTYKGGEFTASEYLSFVRARTSAGNRAQLASASDQDVQTVLLALTKNEILVAEAGKQGLQITRAERDSLATEVRTQLAQAVQATGLVGVQPQEGETESQAIERRVTGLLEAIIRGEQQVLGLGPLSFSLRESYEAQIFDRAFPRVVEKVQANRPPEPAQQPQGELPVVPQPNTGQQPKE